jgi:hypothetical protein
VKLVKQKHGNPAATDMFCHRILRAVMGGFILHSFTRPGGGLFSRGWREKYALKMSKNDKQRTLRIIVLSSIYFLEKNNDLWVPSIGRRGLLVNYYSSPFFTGAIILHLRMGI